MAVRRRSECVERMVTKVKGLKGKTCKEQLRSLGLLLSLERAEGCPHGSPSSSRGAVEGEVLLSFLC